MATTNGLSPEITRKLATTGAQLTKKEFKDVVASFQDEIAQALPRHLKANAERYAKQAFALFSQNPNLQQCVPTTILSALMTASTLGLDLTPQLGQCYILPYANKKKVGNEWQVVSEAQFQIGYRGAIALAYRSNEITRIATEVVYEKDMFEYSKGLHPILNHVESSEEDRGKISHVYAIANFKNGGFVFDVWSTAKVIAHAKKYSKSYYRKDYKTGQQIENDKSPWHTDFDSMAKKTLLLSIWKLLPLSTELMMAMSVDETVKDNISSIERESDVITLPPSDYSDDVVFEEQAEPVKPKPSASKEMTTLQTLEDLLGANGLGLTEPEEAEWCERHFKTGNIKNLTDAQVKDAISKVNDELKTRM